MPSWRLELETDDERRIAVHMPADDRAFERVLNRIKDEAAENRERWGHFHEFKTAMAKLQAPYCLTAHTAQGSTHGTTFVDVRDIRLRKKENLLEMQRILYTAVTRPRDEAVLLGV